MIGTDRHTGKRIDGEAHLRQSITDILTTPIGSRVMRRDYGSLLFELIDQPMNEATRVRLFGATATALQRFEPRFRLTRVGLSPGDTPGSARLELQGQRVDGAGRRVPASLSLPLPIRL